MFKQKVLPVILSVVVFILFAACIFLCAFTVTLKIKNAEETPSYHAPDSSENSIGKPSSDENSKNSVPSLPESHLPASGETKNTDPAASQNSSADPSDNSPTIADQPWLLKENGSAPIEEYLKSIVFLGDSTTHGMIDCDVLPDGNSRNQVWYGPNYTLSLPYATEHLINDGSYSPTGVRLEQIAAEKKPKILVITLGAGISYSTDEVRYKQSYKMVIDTVLTASPNTKIICNTVYPVCKDKFSQYEKINNADIEKINNWLFELVGEYYTAGKSVYYLDSYSLLIGEDGYLPVSYSNGDGLHLSKACYKAILDNLCNCQLP